ncbi:hypothetical protein M3J09_010808 [Ascochyta lentis]
MNWTGGSLQRTKNAHKGVVQRQKAHFARARTQLQQSPGAPIMPFRPDYLVDGDGRESGHHLSPFGSSIRHTGHSPRRHRERDERDISSIPRSSRHLQETNPHFSLRKRSSGTEREKKRDRGKRATDIDTEMQLLEANKERLLRQQDWIGVAPSRPVDLQFLSVKEKNRIGKRRKMEGKSRATARRQSPTVYPHRTGEDELEDHGDAFMSGALPIPSAADKIRVRIGSHALTAVSTQPNNDARSQTNSDSMLFDEEGEEAVESETAQSITASGHVHAANPKPMNERSAESYEDCSPQHDRYTNHGLTAQSEGDAEGHIGTNTLHLPMQASEATDSSYHITHHVGGIDRPLKLVFGKQSLSKASRAASSTDQTGLAQRAHANLDAEDVETGRASQNIGAAHRSSLRRPPIPSAIIDDEPWRTFLGIGQSSSDHVCVDNGTGTSVPQPHIPARTTAYRTSWPQHTTQGKLTHANLPNASACLPALKRPSGCLSEARPNLQAGVVKEIDEHEKLWRSFVLGSDAESAIDTIHTRNDTSEDLMSQATKGYASTRLPLSTAVTSVSSPPFQRTPFRSVSGQASRISEDVQYTPHSGSRSITPAAPPHTTWGRLDSYDEDELQGEGQGQEISARSRFGETSTPASLQNYATHDSDMFGDTRRSRHDLDQHDRGWDDVSRQVQASGSVLWQSSGGSYIGDIPSSDGAGIDLVDVDRLT